MVFIYWATHVLQRQKQKVTNMWIRVNLKKLSKFGLFYVTLKYEDEIVSNYRLVYYSEL